MGWEGGRGDWERVIRIHYIHAWYCHRKGQLEVNNTSILKFDIFSLLALQFYRNLKYLSVSKVLTLTPWVTFLMPWDKFKSRNSQKFVVLQKLLFLTCLLPPQCNWFLHIDLVYNLDQLYFFIDFRFCSYATISSVNKDSLCFPIFVSSISFPWITTMARTSVEILGSSGNDENICYIYNFKGSSLSASYLYLYYWLPVRLVSCWKLKLMSSFYATLKLTTLLKFLWVWSQRDYSPIFFFCLYWTLTSELCWPL